MTDNVDNQELIYSDDEDQTKKLKRGRGGRKAKAK
jgi:hypothetical protein